MTIYLYRGQPNYDKDYQAMAFFALRGGNEVL